MKFSCVWIYFDLISLINSPMGWHPLKKKVPALKNMLPVCKLGAGALTNLHIILHICMGRLYVRRYIVFE
jgi:hypothetical protein